MPVLLPKLRLNRTGFSGGCFVWFLRRQGGLLQVLVVAGFGFGRRDVVDWLEEASVIEPIDSLEGGPLDRALVHGSRSAHDGRFEAGITRCGR
jgi:hypothetical protein